MADPIIFGTQKDYAWDAFQTAFDAGKLVPDRANFETWWTEFGLTVHWKDLHEMMEAAWGKGVQHRVEVCEAGFDAWWPGNSWPWPTPTEAFHDRAWAASQAAFDAGKLLPDYNYFQNWWVTCGLTITWKDEHDMMSVAWKSGVQCRNIACTAGFNSWWQEILDTQPIVDGKPIS